MGRSSSVNEKASIARRLGHATDICIDAEMDMSTVKKMIG
jgi:hypothetical protein